jgi:tetratricopeptide (TPR) repeat protein
VELDRWHWHTGDDFVQKMSAALERADAVVALFSRNYFAPGRWTREEWSATIAIRGRLVPIAIEPLAAEDIPALLTGRLRKDLHGLDEASATTALLEAVYGPARPSGSVPFPGVSEIPVGEAADMQRPRLPSSVGLPKIWNVRRPNPEFTGREAEIVELRDGLLTARQPVVYALHGMGGVGKTQIALEYAHRFSSQYDIIWWFDAEHVDQLPVHYTELAKRLGVAKPEAGSESNAHALLQHLQTRGRWLLILDNAEQPDRVEPWLPEGPGHVLITTRTPDWRGIAHQVDLGVFERSDSLGYLFARIPAIGSEQADRLAQDLGDLPLALAQAAGVLRTGMSVVRYRELLATNTARLLQESDLRNYPTPLAATVNIAVARLRAEGHQNAEALLRLGAFLGPDPIPTAWLETARAHISTVPGDPDDLMWPHNALRPLSRYGVARTDLDTFQIHRLTQAVLRAQTGSSQTVSILQDVIAVLTTVEPGDADSPNDWPVWASLTAHVTVAHVTAAAAEHAGLRRTLTRVLLFLLRSGQTHAAHTLSARLYGEWIGTLGPDHRDVLTCAQYLGQSYLELGEYKQALAVIEDTLARRRATLGADHPDTLRSAHDAGAVNFALGHNGLALNIAQEVFEKRRRVLGEDHYDTLLSADSVAIALMTADRLTEAYSVAEAAFGRSHRSFGENHQHYLKVSHTLGAILDSLGEKSRARHLLQSTMTKCREALGENHIETLRVSQSYATLLRADGDCDNARSILEYALTQSRRALGEDHPNTLEFAFSLAITLRSLHRRVEAVRLLEDVHARRRRVLGVRHPDTERVAQTLASLLTDMGKTFAAQQLVGQKGTKKKRRFGRKRR